MLDYLYNLSRLFTCLKGVSYLKPGGTGETFGLFGAVLSGE